MKTMDKGVESVFSMSVSGMKLTGRLVLEGLEKSLDFIKIDPKNKESHFQEAKTEKGKMGVDFSVTKAGKDEYFIFFAGKDSASIEKGMGQYRKQ